MRDLGRVTQGPFPGLALRDLIAAEDGSTQADEIAQHRLLPDLDPAGDGGLVAPPEAVHGQRLVRPLEALPLAPQRRPARVVDAPACQRVTPLQAVLKHLHEDLPAVLHAALRQGPGVLELAVEDAQQDVGVGGRRCIRPWLVDDGGILRSSLPLVIRTSSWRVSSRGGRCPGAVPGGAHVRGHGHFKVVAGVDGGRECVARRYHDE
ncbi:hypothetical protein B0T26DRAFT_262035 [Lasiosphaeria miniovina]|uniref:Uncharacterized protein n=1 Tax=Lasiosphaeria miniovina TaxID=1954250 RepID=A0AA40E0K5_9PEZI|nr:uncharacterized protein B0T26DRAFT_262035 [Lasiosphaeria miniovina]KAK0723499.1 hypothetical protein B0T26DRAFT_262035 [Lasiosphaeria miniovina]